MNNQFDELTKDLAKGVSRRTALGRFLAGTGAAITGLLLSKKANAQPQAQICMDYCNACYDGADFGQCIAHSNGCSTINGGPRVGLEDQCATLVSATINGAPLPPGEQHWACRPLISMVNGSGFRCQPIH